MEVVGHADKGEDEQHVAVAGVAVLSQDVQHLAGVLIAGDDAPVGAFAEEVEEAICRVRVVTRVWLERELAMKEDDGITVLKEVFC